MGSDIGSYYGIVPKLFDALWDRKQTAVCSAKVSKTAVECSPFSGTSEGGQTMIARIWQGRTRPGMGKAYYSYLEQTGLKEYRRTEGFKDVLVLTRDTGEETEYVLITLWDSMEAVQRFAGPEPERAVYYPEDDRYFPESERTPYVRHYEVVGAS